MQTVPHTERWGIYTLGIETQTVDLLYSSAVEIASLRLNHTGDRLVFSQKADGESNSNEEIFTLSTEGDDLRRITDNNFWDLYPVWSPDGSRIAFLSQRTASLGIYVMNADGGDARLLYDSSSHEADIDWTGDQIVFTKNSSIWIMQEDRSDIRQITHPPRAGEWGKANLPYGDYDPRISPDGSRVVFERLVDDQSPHGNYDLFILDLVSGNELRLTQSGYSQGLAQWSSTGDQIVYVVAAIGGAGQYDLYLMNVDGTGSRNITPPYFPPEFLCHWAVFSNGDQSIYFIGEWWPAQKTNQLLR
ncbi:MAG: PD40 domain-containing protein [Anaerolineales bacterium]|nr:PD40 domain-containing protein [Anaerolineales bacterium]